MSVASDDPDDHTHSAVHRPITSVSAAVRSKVLIPVPPFPGVTVLAAPSAVPSGLKTLTVIASGVVATSFTFEVKDNLPVVLYGIPIL